MTRPNILLLHTDQQRFDTIHALGAQHMLTPNMDRLVRLGTSFTSAYSANPVCMPARHDLITGVSARHHGYYHNANQPIADYGLETVPRMLTAAGYRTMAVGKMHFNPPREHHGFEQMYLMEELPTCRENDAYLRYLDEVGYGGVRCQHGVRPLFYHTPQISQVPEEHHGSAWVASKAIELIREERDEPFFIFASWVGPHPPYYMPERYLGMYRDQPIPAPSPGGMDDARHAPPSPENPELEDLRPQRLREAYFGATSLIDAHIGRILDVLEETGQIDNTVILFAADHGEMLGDRGQYQKHVPYEGSAHIPLIACGPGFDKDTVCAAPATTWDAAATILDAAGVVAPTDHPLLGASLSSPGAQEAGRIVVYHHSVGRGRYVAAVGEGHKFIHWLNGGDEELYDLAADPWELHNLIKDEGHHALLGRLRRACVAFERDHGIAENVRNDAFVDLSFTPPKLDFCSLYPAWSYQQFPRWMIQHGEDQLAPEDVEAIAGQMLGCLDSDILNIPSDAQWRERATAVWVARGGDPTIYKRIFAEVDRQTSND